MGTSAGQQGQAELDRWAENFDENGYFVIRPTHIPPSMCEAVEPKPSLVNVNGNNIAELKAIHRQSLPDWHFEMAYGEKK